MVSSFLYFLAFIFSSKIKSSPNVVILKKKNIFSDLLILNLHLIWRKKQPIFPRKWSRIKWTSTARGLAPGPRRLRGQWHDVQRPVKNRLAESAKARLARKDAIVKWRHKKTYFVNANLLITLLLFPLDLGCGSWYLHPLDTDFVWIGNWVPGKIILKDPPTFISPFFCLSSGGIWWAWEGFIQPSGWPGKGEGREGRCNQNKPGKFNFNLDHEINLKRGMISKREKDGIHASAV